VQCRRPFASWSGSVALIAMRRIAPEKLSTNFTKM
jgi:hypothetical protein